MSDCNRCAILRAELSVQTRRARELESVRSNADRYRDLANDAERLQRQAKANADHQKQRAQDIAAELARFVVEHGVTHLDGCPEDDTCRCPHVERINRLLRDYPEASYSAMKGGTGE